MLSSFLKKIKLNELTEWMIADLDQPIEEYKIIMTISKMKNNKSPGPDGYINEFYKRFKEQVSPLLLRANHYVLQSGTVEESRILVKTRIAGQFSLSRWLAE